MSISTTKRRAVRTTNLPTKTPLSPPAPPGNTVSPVHANALLGKKNRQPAQRIPRPAPTTYLPSSGSIYQGNPGSGKLSGIALEQEFTGKIKCIYIDPPFNTGEMFEHYDDGIEHSVWLTQMRDRLQILHRLLKDSGTLFVHIDDNELGYLIVLLDEIFGRSNRLYVVTFKQGSATGHKSINPGCVSTTNFLLIYAKRKEEWCPNRVFTARDRDTRYNQFIVNVNEHHTKWRIITLAKAFSEHLNVSDKVARKVAKEEPSRLDEFVQANANHVIRTARPDYKGVSEKAREMIDRSKAHADQILHLAREGHSDMYFKNGERLLFYSDKLKLVDGEYVAGEPLTTLWDDILSNNLHKEGGVEFPKGKKPESLVKRCIELTSNPGDWVLDSFAGSGTTGGVAHMMKRRWIMVELRDHCHTHVIPRLKRIVDGQEDGVVAKGAGWRGGGGFRYYYLAPSLLEKDEFGNWIISKQYNPAMLAEAICKLEGFRYAPSETAYWQHGQATESDYIYVTTQTLSRDQIAALSEEVGDKRSLLVMCGAFRVRNMDAFPNLTIKKIPGAVLSRCEWDKDDYSLEIKNLPAASFEPEPDEPPVPAFSRSARKARMAQQGPTLFDVE